MSKPPILISIVLLAAIAGLGWHHRQRLTEIRADHEKLVAEAATLGIFPDPAHRDGRVLSTRPAVRGDKAAEAKRAAADIIELIRNADLEGNAPFDGETAKHAAAEIMNRLLLLDAAQLKVFIAEVRGNRDLTDEDCRGVVSLAAVTLAGDHPQAALELVTASSNPLQDSFITRDIVDTALAAWANDDLPGAVSWVREHGRKFPDLVPENFTTGLLTTAASQDPKLAFQLIDELGLPDSGTIERIVKAAGTPEERHATLAAVRDYAATLPEGHKSRGALNTGIQALAFLAGSQGQDFATASRWIEAAGLSSEELEAATIGTHRYMAQEDADRWIEWLGNSPLPDNIAKDRIHQLAAEWTRKDHQAAGQWLVDAPDGPAKETAVRAFAETVLPYDRDAAYQWAQTLPPGPDRDRTLRKLDARSQNADGD